MIRLLTILDLTKMKKILIIILLALLLQGCLGGTHYGRTPKWTEIRIGTSMEDVKSEWGTPDEHWGDHESREMWYTNSWTGETTAITFRVDRFGVLRVSNVMFLD